MLQTLQILCKSRKGYAPVGRLYSTFWWDQSKNFSFGVLHPCHCTDGSEIWHGGGDLRAKFHPHRCNVSPLRGEKPQNWPLSKLNTGRFALRAMLPVKIAISQQRFDRSPRNLSRWRILARWRMSSLLEVKYTTFQKSHTAHGRRINNNKKSRYVDKAF